MTTDEKSPLTNNVQTYFEGIGYNVYVVWEIKNTPCNVESINGNLLEKDKKYIVFMHNDIDSTIRFPSNVVVFRSCLIKSLKRDNDFVYPVYFVNDPCYSSSGMTIGKCLKTNKPKISFCGSINTFPLRYHWLETLRNSSLIECNFIYRSQFRGGSKEDFVRNLESSEFAFCPRGTGNFSLRFYESLYYGRIPVIIDTDLCLPFENSINWNEIIIIDQDINKIPLLISEFWIKNDISLVQEKCKQICSEYFGFENVAKYFHKEIQFYEDLPLDFKSNIFYSQLGEDLYIYQHFVNRKTNGIFVELGGMDGITFSNSKFFEDVLGFKGVLIEPTALFHTMSRNRPNCKNYNYAINYEKSMVDFVGDDASSGIIATMPEFMKQRYHQFSRIYEVPGIPIRDLLEDISYIDLLFIDVEGAEKIVLETMNWDIEVYVIVIELHNIDIKKDEDCRNILREKGFKFDTRLCTNEIWYNENYLRKNILYNPKLILKGNSLQDFGHFPYVEKGCVSDILKTVLK